MTDQAGCNVPHYHECDLKDAEIDKEKKEEGGGVGGGGEERGEGGGAEREGREIWYKDRQPWKTTNEQKALMSSLNGDDASILSGQ